MRAFAKGKPFLEVRADGGRATVFSEGFLYPKMSKDDARFILAVADEYTHIIQLLGEGIVKGLLDIDRTTGNVPPGAIKELTSLARILGMSIRYATIAREKWGTMTYTYPKCLVCNIPTKTRCIWCRRPVHRPDCSFKHYEQGCTKRPMVYVER